MNSTEWFDSTFPGVREQAAVVAANRRAQIIAEYGSLRAYRLARLDRINSRIAARTMTRTGPMMTPSPIRKGREYSRRSASVVARITGGPYTGRFPRARPVGDSYYELKGYRRENEFNAQITTNDAVYVGGTASRMDQLGRAVCAALLRRLFKSSFSRMEISDEDVVVNASTNTMWIMIGSRTYHEAAGTLPNETRSRWTVNDVTQTLPDIPSVDIAPGNTFFDVVTKFWAKMVYMLSKGYKPFALAYLPAPNTLNVDPIDFQFNINEGLDGTGVPRGAYVYYIDGLGCKAYSTLHVYLQNATTADGGGTQVTEVASNPVQYRLCTFHGMFPELMHPYQNYDAQGGDEFNGNLNGIENWQADSGGKPEGVILPSRAYNGLTWIFKNPVDDFRCLPTKNTFANCKNMATGYLQPGAIKSYKCKYRIGGDIVDVLHRCSEPFWRWTTSQSVAANNTSFRKIEQRGNHKSFMFVFEKMVHTGANSVVINCDYEMQTGAILTYRKQRCLKSFHQATLGGGAADFTTAVVAPAATISLAGR